MDRIARIKEILKDSPDDSFLKHALALEYIKLNNDTDARQLFEELLSHEPGYVGSYYHLGKLLERVGETEQAISVYQKGIEMAKTAKEKHAMNELLAALDDLI
ncbi:Tetratricopeptide repeat-containing protein [Chitinophaga sp. CF118]|uniref:tetratricopeptide repeat protein n=1 Tax=Chitinophaga sp. CF118 TaxID=1884367 RepID=UPI0008ECAC66|nr:tetratricopeptide repeat protein [Chitinophaga sp. CF118]SFF11637.1 Tetratricopeptide repeat-containing protein [Chitinophaga sp. CF118]